MSDSVTSEARRAANREHQRRYREANPEKIREYMRGYREANREAISTRKRQYREANREAVRESKRRWREAIRAEVLTHYSPSSPPCCACCGTTERLTVDHVNGGGTEHRMELFGRAIASTPFYQWLIAEGFPPGYQVLCNPCNTSKGNGPACRLNH